MFYESPDFTVLLQKRVGCQQPDCVEGFYPAMPHGEPEQCRACYEAPDCKTLDGVIQAVRKLCDCSVDVTLTQAGVWMVNIAAAPGTVMTNNPIETLAKLAIEHADKVPT